MKYIKKVKRNQKSVQSIHQCKSVIQTMYNIVKAHGGELKVETKVNEANPNSFGNREGTTFIINLSV